MVRCATGHPSLSACGAVVKGHTYYRCTYGQNYGKVAADAISGHGATCNMREDLFDAFDLRVVYDKATDRLSISATLTEAVASMLRGGLEPRLLKEVLRGWDSNPQPRH
jgi:hypothetical protein